MAETNVRQVIIIGGGPAGYTAALYTARANLNPLVIEGFAWGGQLMITSDVENYPGYPEGVLGPQMMQEFRTQAARFGTEFITDDVTRVDFSEQPYRVWVGDTEYQAETVIVATGAVARQLGLESEQKLQGAGVSYCAVCDAAFFKDREVVVVGRRRLGDGGGRLPGEVREQGHARASARGRSGRRRSWSTERAPTTRSSSCSDTVVEEVRDTDAGRVTSVLVRNVKTRRDDRDPGGRSLRRNRTRSRRRSSSAASSTWTRPATSSRTGKSTRTNVEGVFAAGDVQDHVYRQAVTAAGSGCQAALDAERYLAAREGGSTPADVADEALATPTNW